MNSLFEYWYVFIALIVLLTVGGLFVYKFIKNPTDVQISKVREWLLIAVVEAEKKLGDGTGRLKLRYVYDLFLDRFGWLAQIVSFDLFSELVDQALEEMRDMLQTNPQVAQFVEKGRE